MERNQVTSVRTVAALLGALLCVTSAAAQAADPNAGGTNNNAVTRAVVERIGPLDNTAVTSARIIVADGTSLFQPIAPADTRWFAFEAEPGKTYVADILDPYSDLGANVIGSVAVTDSSGCSVFPTTCTAPPEANSNCSAAATSRAPGLEVSGDGWRCIIRTDTPQTGKTQNKRGIFIGVGAGGGNSFQIRVREATMYGRWTTNGYDFHIELQNTTADSMCAMIVLNPNVGYSWNGATWTVTGTVFTTQLTVPPMGAVKTVVPAGTLSGADNRGTLRITDCGTGQLVPNALNLSSYAFNPVTSVYLFFTPTKSNQGGQNTW